MRSRQNPASRSSPGRFINSDVGWSHGKQSGREGLLTKRVHVITKTARFPVVVPHPSLAQNGMGSSPLAST